MSKKTASVSHATSSSRTSKLHLAPSVCVAFSFSFQLFRTLIWTLPQLPDAAVTDLRLPYDADADAESPTTSRIPVPKDPYNIGHGLKTDAEITELRRRKQGKRLAGYHRRQNDVRVSSFFFRFTCGPFSSLRFYAQLIASLLKPMEEHTEDARNEEDLSRLPVSPRP
jgi:hypothetical protein